MALMFCWSFYCWTGEHLKGKSNKSTATKKLRNCRDFERYSATADMLALAQSIAFPNSRTWTWKHTHEVKDAFSKHYSPWVTVLWIHGVVPMIFPPRKENVQKNWKKKQIHAKTYQSIEKASKEKERKGVKK